MSRRLLQLVMPVFPDRRMFRIHDPEVHPDAPGGPLPPIGVLVSASREQLWVGSLQQDIDVRLVLEEWDGQPLLPDAWDEEAKARLYLRGRLSVDMGSAGPAVSGLRLSGGVGNYEVRVYARYREAVVQMYADLFSQHRDPLSATNSSGRSASLRASSGTSYSSGVTRNRRERRPLARRPLLARVCSCATPPACTGALVEGCAEQLVERRFRAYARGRESSRRP